MTQNITIFQFFHWYVSNDGQWWNYCASQAEALASKGITHVYFPPAYKSAFGGLEPGYAVYDLFDLGEFDQKGSVKTKYGTKEEYLKCIEVFHKNNIQIIADIVLNHKMGADETESFTAVLVNQDNRNEIISQPETIEAYTKFNFPGRKGKYSNFEWNFTTFSGVDGEKDGNKVIYKILNEYGDKWEDVMEKEFGNFDFLMGSDTEFRNEHVREELKRWGKWYIETTGVDGFRMDAVKHISPEFIKMWLQYVRQEFNKNFFAVSEYWKSDVNTLLKYLDVVENTTQLMDVPLHFNFHEASLKKRDYDLRKIFDGSLVQAKPELSVTFVANHDTQPLQALESTVDFWFKPLAYALILLREQGIPLIFYPGLYGAEYKGEKEGREIEINLVKVEAVEQFILVRKEIAYGNQVDYFDHANVIGWVRQGIDEKPDSGCAVVMSNGADGFKEMDMGKRNANKEFYDVTGKFSETISTDENGVATFLVKENSVSVWAAKKL